MVTFDRLCPNPMTIFIPKKVSVEGQATITPTARENRSPPVMSEVFRPRRSENIAHWDRSDQRRHTAGGHQHAEQRFIVSLAEDVKIEQQAVNPHCCAGKNYAQKIEARIGLELAQAVPVGGAYFVETRQGWTFYCGLGWIKSVRSASAWSIASCRRLYPRSPSAGRLISTSPASRSAFK